MPTSGMSPAVLSVVHLSVQPSTRLLLVGFQSLFIDEFCSLLPGESNKGVRRKFNGVKRSYAPLSFY
jgi:hypothetical protein